MATTSYTYVELSTYGDQGHIVTWALIANGDDGTPLAMVGSADRAIQITGTFGSGGSITIQGSNDGSTYATLHDPGGNDLTFTSPGIHAVLEITKFIRPKVTAGDGTTSLNAILLVRRP